MASKHISDAFVRTVKPPRPDKGDKRQVTYIDTIERGLALVLVVSYGGTKAFRVLTYRNGRPHSVKLGTYPAMTVKEARAKARTYWENPKQFEEQAAVGTFKEIAENWFKRHVEANKLRSAGELRRHLVKYIYPKWAGTKFIEIRRREVNELLDHIADDHGRYQADAVLATLRSIMAWHQSRDDNYVSPIVRMMQRNKAKQARNRILNDNEIRRVWEACTDINGTFGAMIKLLLLTAQRKTKVTTMRWDDISSDGEWTIRTERREKGTGDKLKLPQLALDVLAEQHKHRSVVGNPYVFPGRGKTAFNSFSDRKRELDAKLPDMEPWVLHDLRRTARSLMSKAGVRPDIAERVLGHVQPAMVKVYDRHAYDAEKADALNRLAALIDRIVHPPEDNVVPLRAD
jgi:integrase